MGLAAAVRAARAGLAVTVVEPRPAPIDKACGEGLMPPALRELAALGVHPEGYDFVGIRYVDEGCGVAAQANFTNGRGRGVRRTTLHASLAGAAASAGVGMVTDRVVDVGWDATRAAVLTSGGRRIVGTHVLAADGLRSPMRRRAGLTGPGDLNRGRFGLRQHFAIAPWSSCVDVHWAGDAEAYVTPVSDNVVGVALLTRRRAPFDQLLQQFPQLVRRLGAAEALDRVRGAGPLMQRASHRRRGRLLLVGDAAGYIDALTGEGLAAGLASARVAVTCVLGGDTGAYERRWRSATRRSRWLTRLALTTAETPQLRGSLVTQAKAHPAVFAAAVRALA